MIFKPWFKFWRLKMGTEWHYAKKNDSAGLSQLTIFGPPPFIFAHPKMAIYDAKITPKVTSDI